MSEPHGKPTNTTAWTPGPWQWFGNTDTDRGVYLATQHGGRVYVLDARADLLSCACCGDYDYDTETFTHGCDPSENHRVRPRMRFQSDHRMVDAEDLALYEVVGYQRAEKDDQRLYRRDFAGIDHPDAKLIALAPDMAEAIEGLCACYDEGGEELDDMDAWKLLHDLRGKLHAIGGSDVG
jgi:hypothetical protein